MRLIALSGCLLQIQAARGSATAPYLVVSTKFSVIGRRCTLYALFGSIYFTSAKVQIVVALLSIRQACAMCLSSVLYIYAADCRA